MSAHSQPKSSVIIACDVGLKRIGLATLLNGIVLPLEPIIRKNRNQAARDLREVLQMRKANAEAAALHGGQHSPQLAIIHRNLTFCDLNKKSNQQLLI